MAFNLRKDDHLILNALAKVNIIMGEYKKAEDYLKQIPDYLVETSTTLTNRSILKAYKNDYEVGDFDDPNITLKKVLEQDPYNHEALLNRAILLDAAGAYSEAKVDFDKASVLDPKDYLHLIAKGFSKIYEEDFDKAEKDFKTVLSINCNSIECLLGIGLLYDAIEKYKLAIEEYDKILDINPNNIFAKRYKASALAQIGDIKSASYIID